MLLLLVTDGEPVVCTGSSCGDIALWDLSKRKLRSTIHSAHSTSVTGMKCLPSQPILVTSSPDNALKVSLSLIYVLTVIYAITSFYYVCMKRLYLLMARNSTMIYRVAHRNVLHMKAICVGCKAELTWVVVIFQDSVPVKYGHLSQK